MHQSLRTLIPLALMAMLVDCASAAPIYFSELEYYPANSVYATGGASLSGAIPVAGGGFIAGQVHMDGALIELIGAAGTGQGSTAGIDSFGRVTVNDLMFTDLSDPSATGLINASANFLLDWGTNSPSGDRVIVRTNINGGASELNDTNGRVTATGNYGITSLAAIVPLNTLISFSFEADLRISDSFLNGTELGNATLQFLGFNLDTGYTANSVDLNLVDNAIVDASPVPAPATILLFSTGILLGAGFKRWPRRTAGSAGRP